MLSKSFKITEPKRFDLYIEDIILNKSSEALVKVNNAAICKADLRYYMGDRDKRLLAFKYPMSLIHEATGIVLDDPTGMFKVGDRVVFVPNRVELQEPCVHCVCEFEELGENYCPSAIFASSSSDGFSREIVNYPVTHLVKIPSSIPTNHAVFSEMISVAVAIVRRTTIPKNVVIGIWGDGILGYIVSLVLRAKYPALRIVVFGKHEEKLNLFQVDAYYHVDDQVKEKIGIGYECVGGGGAESAINQMIDHSIVGGTIILTGVTEEKVAMNTRKILEKGLTLKGVTRSNREDFNQAMELLQCDTFSKAIEQLILHEHDIESIVDYYQVFEIELQNKKLGKHLLKFNF